MALRIRKGDLVQVISGVGSGEKTQGRVLAIDHVRSRIRVQGVRMQKRHLKPGRRGARTGGIIEQEGFINASNVMLVDPADNQPSRFRIEERDGENVRVFTKSGGLVPDPQA